MTDETGNTVDTEFYDSIDDRLEKIGEELSEIEDRLKSIQL